MVQLRALARCMLCSTRTDIDNTHQLPSRPKPEGSRRPCTPEEGPQTPGQPKTTLEASQRLFRDINFAEDLNSLMPPKRKNEDTSADMDRPDKKTKTTKKGRKASSIAEDDNGKAWWRGEVWSSWRLASGSGLNSEAWGAHRGANGGLRAGSIARVPLDDASHLAPKISPTTPVHHGVLQGLAFASPVSLYSLSTSLPQFSRRLVPPFTELHIYHFNPSIPAQLESNFVLFWSLY
ncbi:Nn.00g104550.m01.CDS01 [Neocucurbitaria sp. VM-36]